MRTSTTTTWIHDVRNVYVLVYDSMYMYCICSFKIKFESKSLTFNAYQLDFPRWFGINNIIISVIIHTFFILNLLRLHDHHFLHLEFGI